MMWALLAVDALLVLLAWGGFSRAGFAADTLFQRMLPMSNIGGDLDHGRYAIYFLAKTLYEHGFLITDHYYLFYGLFLISITASIFLIQKLFLPFFQNRAKWEGIFFLAGYTACTALPFVNVLFSECFMFSEYHLNYAIAWFLGVLSAFLLSRKRWISGSLCVIAACLFYQMALILAVMLLSAYFVFEADFRLSRRLVVKEVLSNVLILFVGFLDNRSSYLLAELGIIRPEDVGKVISTEWRDTLKYLLQQTILLMKNSLQLLPSVWAPGLMTLAALAVLLTSLIRRRERERAVTVLLLALAELILFYIMPGLAGTDSFYPRMTFTWYLLQTVLLLTAAFFTDRREQKQLLTCLCAGYLALQLLFCQLIAANRSLSNQLDLLYARAVLREIDKYEERTGTQIKNIATVRDIDAPNSYEAVRWKRDQVNERVLSISPFVLLEHANGDDRITYTHIEMDEKVYEEHFAGKNWDCFDPAEQLLFQDDTLYWVIF